MPSNSPFLPARLQLVEQQMITLVFNQYWDQEDIRALSDMLFTALGQVSRKNTVLGADREDIHFYWHEACYILYFESNSQSCWIEAESAENHACLSQMFALLTSALS